MICAMIRLGWHPRRIHSSPCQGNRSGSLRQSCWHLHHIKTQRKVLLLFKSSEEFAMIQVQLALKCFKHPWKFEISDYERRFLRTFKTF